MTDSNEVSAHRAEWQRQQRRVRHARDFGLLLLALGVLVLVYVALLATGG